MVVSLIGTNGLLSSCIGAYCNKNRHELNVYGKVEPRFHSYTAISKRMLSRFFSSFSAPFSFLHFILPTIYGESESTYRLIPYTLKSIADGVDLALTSGDQVRQYIYIRDVAGILFKAVEANLQSGIYNIAGAEEFSVKQLVALLFGLKRKNMPDGLFGKTQRVDNASLYSFPFIKFLNERSLCHILKRHRRIITIEEHQLNGRFGSTILEYINDLTNNGTLTEAPPVKRIGIQDSFCSISGSQRYLRELAGIVLKPEYFSGKA